MRRPLLKATTSLCLSLSLLQPLPGAVRAQGAAPDCVPGSRDCPIAAPGKAGRTAPAEAPRTRPRGGAQQAVPAVPRQRDQAPPPARSGTQPRPAQPSASGQQNRSQPAPRTPRVAPAVPGLRVQPRAPVDGVQPRPAQPSASGQQNRSQPAPRTPRAAPAVPGLRVQPRAPVDGVQPRPAPPPASGQQNRSQPQRPLPPPRVEPRQAPVRPRAAPTPPSGLPAGPATSTVRIAPGDLRPSHENRFRPRPRAGMTDLEKFGLILLGTAVVGTLLADGERVVLNSGDRVVARDRRGRYHVYHDDTVLLRRPGTTIVTERYLDGSVLTRILYPGGLIIFTLCAYDGYMLRRWVQYPHGATVVLFDDTQVLPPPVIARLPPRSPVRVIYTGQTGPDLVRAALMAQPLVPAGRSFNLSQIRDIPEVRYLVPEIEIASLDFASGSAAIPPDQARSLAVLAGVMTGMIAQNPAEMFLIEGHSDAVGDPAMNLALSDARAEATAAALTDHFGVPPQNMVIQGYGEADPREQTQGPSVVNRRVILRRITPLLPPAPEGVDSGTGG